MGLKEIFSNEKTNEIIFGAIAGIIGSFLGYSLGGSAGMVIGGTGLGIAGAYFADDVMNSIGISLEGEPAPAPA